MLNNITKLAVLSCLFAVLGNGSVTVWANGPTQASLPTRMALVVSALPEEGHIVFKYEDKEPGTWLPHAHGGSIYWSGEVNKDGIVDYIVLVDSENGESAYMALVSLFGAQYFASELGSYNKMQAYFETDHPVFCGTRIVPPEQASQAASGEAGLGCYCYGNKYGAFYMTEQAEYGEHAGGANLCLHRELGDYLTNTVHVAE